MPSAQHQWSPAPNPRNGRPTDLLYALPRLTFRFNDAQHNRPPPPFQTSQQTRKAADFILRQGDVHLKVDHMILPAINRALEVNTPRSFPRPAQLDVPFLRRWDDSIASLTSDLRSGEGSDHATTKAVVAEVVTLANRFLGTRWVPKAKRTQWAAMRDWPDLHLLPKARGLLIWTNSGADTGWVRLLATLGNSSITIQRRAGSIHTKPYAHSQELCDVIAELLFTMHSHRLTYLVVTSGPATAIFELDNAGLSVSPLLTNTLRGLNLLTVLTGLALMIPDPPPSHFVDLRPIDMNTQLAIRSPPLPVNTRAVNAPVPPLPPLPILPMAPPPPPLEPVTSPPKTPNRVYRTPIPSAPNSRSMYRYYEGTWAESNNPSPSTPTFDISQLALISGGVRKRRRQAGPSTSAPDLTFLPDFENASASTSRGHRPTASYSSVPPEHTSAAVSPGHDQLAHAVPASEIASTSRTSRIPHGTPRHAPGSRSSSRMSMPQSYSAFPGGEAYNYLPSSPNIAAIEGPDEPILMLSSSSPQPIPNNASDMAGPSRTGNASTSTRPGPSQIAPVTHYTLKRMREITPPQPKWIIPSYGSLTLSVDPGLRPDDRTPLLHHATSSSYTPVTSTAKCSTSHLHLTITWMNQQTYRWREFVAELPAGNPGPNRPLPVSVQLFSPDYPPAGRENMAEWLLEEAIEDGENAEGRYPETFVGFFKSTGEVRVYALIVIDMARLAFEDM
ncbi:hypothetical protein CcaverHIS002_0200350 [Cutaneotrichosporon cavernicola]|uniref:Uncharacterized protein n=1 Tax=Cutaneotrichosporon cavernicola TaxID=279322 RepID=A0AA48I3H6_9TREE|nr:uncharacterized protein CcaverHIS019_0200390 [Cutaneotrichosporon cavernicola]BEI80875.1 hypothetical protein CcaverHIS002_0200350 [Cutaneotrichosporon cavernicola]BEI88677.1 hypothetical protein CcaverHIS019_0200390 [Cutaneotrichosporon cavernicola]BEI96450.1 hypothetical protein CcaverHIS631_0200390 [Cutaneotrichosporon cavernicola]BEJ04223.1 hypothetical protein CcaverHIS641_0200400 [Cutaneotrichosporon cavernicola]